MRDRIAALLHLDLRGRVTVATAGVLAIGLAALTLGTLLFLRAQLASDATSILRERADAALSTVTVRNGHVALLPPTDSEGGAWVYAGGGRVLRRGVGDARVQHAADALATIRAPRESSIGEHLRLRAEPFVGGAPRRQVATVVVSIDLEPYEHTKHLVAVAMAALDVCILAIGVLLARRAVGRALAPVADMTRQASDWSERDLDRRFDLGPPRDELTALSATLDALLARIGSSLRHEQRFSAEMAHELRTPLSGVRAEAELALRDPEAPPDVRAALEQILAGAERMQRVIDTLIATARSGSGVAVGVCDVRAAVREAIDGASAAAEREGVVLVGDAKPAGAAANGAILARGRTGAGNGGLSGRVAGRAGAGSGVETTAASPPGSETATALRVSAEHQVVVQALAPLLDNAIRHARGEVRVSVAREAGDVVVRVDDDGPGVAEGDVERIFEPGASTVGSAGLGLPLARRLARSCGGEVTARPSTDGGHFALTLPSVS